MADSDNLTQFMQATAYVRFKPDTEERSTYPVSYTHLDVYKRQGLCNATRRFCAETSAMLEQGLGKALPNKDD